MRRISLAWISMSEAIPRAPPLGWWTMIRALGSATRMPGSPAASRKLPIDAAWPTHTVRTLGLMYCMVSWIAMPAVTAPPGELMYIEISWLFSLSRNSNWATISEAMPSSTGPVTNTIRSRSRRLKMSKLRSPRLVLSTTTGTSWPVTGSMLNLPCALSLPNRSIIKPHFLEVRGLCRALPRDVQGGCRPIPHCRSSAAVRHRSNGRVTNVARLYQAPMKTNVIATLLSGSALFLAPATASAQDSTSAPAPAPAPTSPLDIPHASTEGHVVYTPADFAKYSPKNALDMLNQVPGFSVSGGDQNRGLGEANVNVLINGERLSLKSETIFDVLRKISADKVERIEILDGASLKIPGLSGQVANVVTKAGGLSGQFEWDTRFRPGYVQPMWIGGNASISGTVKTLEYTLAIGNDFGTGAIKGPTNIY